MIDFPALNPHMVPIVIRALRKGDIATASHAIEAMANQAVEAGDPDLAYSLRKEMFTESGEFADYVAWVAQKEAKARGATDGR
jgi:hypothetical protein